MSDSRQANPTCPNGRANTREVLADTFGQKGVWWVEEDLNLRPHAYQACALTT